jgi:serine/threonine-protein kinase
MEGALRPGTILLDKYRIEAVLGRGGMGVVLKVTHLQLGEELALKILSPEAAASPDVNARFLREAQSVSRLRGEHVARVTDVGMLPDGIPYMVMEYLRGVDLAGELVRRGMLSPGEAVDYVLQACEALAEAHASGVVHRDIKPANLFLTTRPDGTPLVKVLDFGISKVAVGANALLTKTDTVMGTQGYMSPEQMKATKDVDARTDIWALGIVLYECLCGRRPFEAESFSAFVLKAATEPAPAMDPRLPRALQGVVLRCLEKDRRARFPSIAELAVALAPFARDQRAAAVVVDRTKLMLQRPGSAMEATAWPGVSTSATTLSGSAGSSRSISRRRYAIAGIISVLGSLGVVAAVTASGRPGRGGEGSGVAQVASDAAEVHVVAPSSPVDAEADAEVRPPVTPPNACDTANVDDLMTQAQNQYSAGYAKSALSLVGKALACRQDERVYRLASTYACAAHDLASAKLYYAKVSPANQPGIEQKCQLEGLALGAPDAAADRTAAERTAMLGKCIELQARRDWQALDDCATKLEAFGATDRTRELHRTAKRETANQIDAGKVQQALRDRDLKQAEVTLEVLGPDSVYYASLRDAFRKVEAPLIEETRRKAQGFATAHDCTALKRYVAQIATTSTERVVAASKVVTCVAKATADSTASKPPAGGREKSERPVSSPPPTQEDSCDVIDFDDLMKQAQNQFGAGYAKSALSIVAKALACRQDERMYRLAATYACAAHDWASAKLYYAKVSPANQAAVVQKCQLEGLTLRGP